MRSLDALDYEDLKMVKKSIARKVIVINNLDNEDYNDDEEINCDLPQEIVH